MASNNTILIGVRSSRARTGSCTGQLVYRVFCVKNRKSTRIQKNSLIPNRKSTRIQKKSRYKIESQLVYKNSCIFNRKSTRIQKVRNKT